MSTVYGPGTPLQMLTRPKTVRTEAWKAVYQAARETATQNLERQVRVDFLDPTWQVRIGYWNGVQFLAYRVCSNLKTWADVEKVVDNHTKNYKGRIKVLGFDAGTCILDTPSAP